MSRYTQKRAGKAAADSSLVRVKPVKLHHADEVGVVGEHSHSLYLDKRDPPSFVIKVPAHVQLALSCAEQVNKPTSELVIEEFSKLMEQFTEWKKNAKATPVILLYVDYTALDENGERFTNDKGRYFGYAAKDKNATVSVGYALALRVADKIYQRQALDIRKPWSGFGADDESKKREEERCEEHNARERRLDVGGGFKVGAMIHRASSESTVLDYTPELHAKIDQVVEALNGAARVLRDIEQSKDVAATLLSLGTKNLLLPGVK